MNKKEESEEKVKDLMVPLAEYATVSEEATLRDAVLNLEKAQKAFTQDSYKHRAVLVFNENKEIVGKVSQLDILKALEKRYSEMFDSNSRLGRFGFSGKFIKDMLEQNNLWLGDLKDICKRGSKRKVKDFMYIPVKGEYIHANAPLKEAVHKLVIDHHHSLLVTKTQRSKEIVGVLRLTDVFEKVFETIKIC